MKLYNIIMYIIIACCSLISIKSVTNETIPFPRYDRDSLLSQLERDCLSELVAQYEDKDHYLFEVKNGRVDSEKEPNLMDSDDFLKRTYGSYGIEISKIDNLCQKFQECMLISINEQDGVTRNDFDIMLKEHAKNKIGRELMYRIIAKFDARKKCVESLERVVTKITNDIKDQSNNLSSSLEMAQHVTNNIGNYIKYDSDSNKKVDIEKIMLAPTKFDNIDICNDNNKIQIIQRDISNSRQMNLLEVNKHLVLFQSIIKSIHNYIQKTRLTIFCGKQYNASYNIDSTKQQIINSIKINCLPSYYNIVSGPLTVDEGIQYIETDYLDMPDHSVFNHELGHYFRMCLECAYKYAGRTEVLLQDIRDILIYKGIINQDYRIHHIWTDAEELNEIFGIRLVTNPDGTKTLQRDRINQSEYNLDIASQKRIDRFGIRYGHLACRVLLAPYKLFYAAFGKHNVNPSDNEVIDNYLSALDIVNKRKCAYKTLYK